MYTSNISDESTHYLIVDDHRTFPVIKKGYIVFLKEIEIMDFLTLGPGNYMALYEDGLKEFYRGQRVDNILWFSDFVTFIPKGMRPVQIKKLYQVVKVYSSEEVAPKGHNCKPIP